MKKILIVSLIAILSILGIDKLYSKDLSPSSQEMFFAMHYFSILYDYDVQAASFAQVSQLCTSEDQLLASFKQQSGFVNSVLVSLAQITPEEKYVSSYSNVTKGLKAQQDYLNAIVKSLESGSSFEKAFAINSWGFLNAQNSIQQGINELKIILESYSKTNQIKVLAATGVTEEQLRQDAFECEYVKNIQDSIK